MRQHDSNVMQFPILGDLLCMCAHRSCLFGCLLTLFVLSLPSLGGNGTRKRYGYECSCDTTFSTILHSSQLDEKPLLLPTLCWLWRQTDLPMSKIQPVGLICRVATKRNFRTFLPASTALETIIMRYDNTLKHV